ncbi:tRNA-specific adenosine deaminase 1 [Pieris napi]|uniref:tRNA-specific adenosine deaminase 1 n=1 Tax=Pieris napi TaxID=78633 RepID=UPI001FBBD494|nr:tRNA-specific adenosine deaminase 1 [Pieris napi]
MNRYKQCIVDKFVEDCIQLFNSISKTGKPLENEWTVLSCIIQYDAVSSIHKVVALGTGSKCIGASKMSHLGNILNDSHAEVIARRGFLLYLYKNIQLCLEGKDSIFEKVETQCKLKENVEFLFYSSQFPCGDASIIRKDDIENIGDIVVCSKRHAQDDVSKIQVKKPKSDVFRTGAKCLENSKQDPKLPGTEYHLLGQVRTKPGRGDRTLSLSCSDKIARWIHLGIQGSLISLLIAEPIYIKHLIFGGGTPYSEDSLKRALFTRDTYSEAKLGLSHHIYQSTITLPCIKTDKKNKPAPSGIIWVNINNGLSEVVVQGKKLGVTRKKENCPNNYLCISKYNLYKAFIEILDNNNKLYKICENEDINNIAYNDMKRRSTKYITKWLEIKQSFFKRWTTKPDIFNFKIK